MIRNLFNRNYYSSALFTGHFIEVKALYVFSFGKVASVNFIGELDMTLAFAYIRDTCRQEIKAVYQHSYYNHDNAEMHFNNSIFVLTNARMIELAEGYCQVLHTVRQHGWANDLVAALAQFRLQTKTEEVRVVGFTRQSEMN